MKKETKKQLLTILILFIFLGSTITVAIISYVPIANTANSASSIPAGVGPLGSTHIHADFKVYINDVAVDFSQSKYQVQSQYIHVENGDGNVLHMHATGETIGFFFNTLKWTFNSNCLITDFGSYCNNGNSTLKFYVNNVTNNQFGNYLIQDQGKLLISYGNDNDTQIQNQLGSITDEAYFEDHAVQSGTATG